MSKIIKGPHFLCRNRNFTHTITCIGIILRRTQFITNFLDLSSRYRFKSQCFCNGYIDENDFKLNAQKLNLQKFLSQKEFENGLKYMDTNNDGKISLNEFIAAIVS